MRTVFASFLALALLASDAAQSEFEATISSTREAIVRGEVKAALSAIETKALEAEKLATSSPSLQRSRLSDLLSFQRQSDAVHQGEAAFQPRKDSRDGESEFGDELTICVSREGGQRGGQHVSSECRVS